MKKGPPVWLFLLAIFAVYAACAFVPYVLCDDYALLLYIREGWTHWTSNGFTRDGRPVASFFMHFSFLACGTLGRLFILRIIALVGLLLFAWYFRKAMSRLGFGGWQGTMLAAIVTLSPGIGEYVGWTVSWPYPYLLLFISWLSLHFSERVAAGDSRRHTAIVCLYTIVALELAFLMYQPIIGFFVVIPLLMMNRGRMKPAVLAIVVLAASFAFYKYVSFNLMHHLNPQWCHTDRSSILPNLPDHWRFLAREFSTFIASGWMRLLLPRGGHMMAGSLVLALAAAGALSTAALWNGRKFFVALATVICAGCIASPQVFLIGDVWAFRTNYPMAVVISILAWSALNDLSATRIRDRINATLFILLLLCAGWAVNAGLPYSAMREYRINCRLLEQLRDSGAQKACILVTPGRFDPQPPVPVYWHSCYGFLSLVLMNDLEPNAVALDVWPDKNTRPEFTFVKADDTANIPDDGTPVLDLWGAIHGTPTTLDSKK